jgi:SMC interacting uncharacterized protein involved in chromosome segregation
MSDPTSERVTYGLKIAHDAYLSRIHELESEVRSLSSSIDQYRVATIEAQKKVTLADAQTLDANRKVAEFTEELRQLTSANKLLTKQVERAKKLQQTFAEALELQVQEETGISESLPIVHAVLNRSYNSMSASIAVPMNTSTAAGSIDGRAFFAEVRKVTSHEEFNKFLAAIKKLNTHVASKDDVVNEAREIFGLKYSNLLADFERLVHRP